MKHSVPDAYAGGNAAGLRGSSEATYRHRLTTDDGTFSADDDPPVVLRQGGYTPYRSECSYSSTTDRKRSVFYLVYRHRGTGSAQVPEGANHEVAVVVSPLGIVSSKTDTGHYQVIRNTESGTGAARVRDRYRPPPSPLHPLPHLRDCDTTPPSIHTHTQTHITLQLPFPSILSSTYIRYPIIKFEHLIMLGSSDIGRERADFNRLPVPIAEKQFR
ncbi:hypothetical protein J6590_050262 [Homalodisca vitripennis]|nr:hypothetical protein J6590_050262 [Homalodisca vitripennis]